ncbi:MAG TPA: hypothetical protein VEY71_02260, partial [Chitinophagales bacterium]|nr:hypothetical protein [Chitinophagales bacterium]
MVRRLAQNDISHEKWNRCVDASTHPLPYAYGWFLNAASPGWNALVENDYESVLPLTHRKKFGIRYLHQPYFTQQLGIFSKHDLTRETARSFANALVEEARLIEINFNYGNGLVGTLQLPRTKWEQRLTHHLDLNQPYDALVKGYSG